MTRAPATQGRANYLVLIVSTLCFAPAVSIALPEEAASDRAAYLTHCSSCHGAGLSGTNFGPALFGESFAAKWGTAGQASLQAYISASMPPAKPNSLGTDVYKKISEFILAEGMAKAEAAEKAGGSAASTHDMSAYKGPAPNQDAFFQAAMARRQDLAGKVTSLDDATLANPSANDWLHFRRTYAGLGYSPLSQIDKTNVHSLGVAWTLSLSTGSNEIAPLIHDGVMYVHSNDQVSALDATNGELLWQYSRPVKAGLPITQPRGMAIYRDKLYISTMDVHFIALEARTGKVVWDHAVVAETSNVWMTVAPSVIRAKVIGGTTNCDTPKPSGGCFIIALDAQTGNEAWRVRSTAQAGEPGGNTWNDAPAEERTGGGIWGTPTYDPELNLLFIGTSQSYNLPVLLQSPTRRGVSGDGLYTDSTLAINPDTGKVVWSFQHLPRDVWNMDWAFERSLLELPIAGKHTKVVVTSGKLGIFDVLEAKSGRFLFARDLGLQNIVASVDPHTGKKQINPDAVPVPGKTVLVCPSTGGVRTWPASAIDPQAKVLFVPATESCMDFSYRPGTAIPIYPVMRPRPDSDGNFGRVAAVDLTTQKTLWVQRRRAPQSSAVLATAGGLVFAGSRDRWFRALDSSNGTALWQIQLNAEPSSFPVAFGVADTQYIAVVTGGGNPTSASWKTLTPEITSPPGAVTTLWVFKLPGGSQ